MVNVRIGIHTLKSGDCWYFFLLAFFFGGCFVVFKKVLLGLFLNYNLICLKFRVFKAAVVECRGN